MRTYLLLLIYVLVGAAIIYQQFYGIDKLVLGSDELHPARALISEDWSLRTFPPDPEESVREFYYNWPIQFPPLFGLLTRLSVVMLGVNHFALRLFPALFALLAVFFGHRLFRLFMRPELACIAAIIMGLASDALIIYAKSLKHYTADVMVTVILLFLAKLLFEKDKTKYWLLFTAVAAIGLWLAFASIFVSVSIFLLLLIKRIFNKPQKRGDFWRRFIFSSIIFTISFIGLYFYSIRNATDNPIFIRQWIYQIFIWSRATDLAYVVHYVGHMVLHILKLPGFFFGNSVFLITITNVCIVYWIISRLKKKVWDDVLLLVLPLFVVMLGSICGKYPFSADRLSLFLLPTWLIMIVCGLNQIIQLLKIGDTRKIYITIFALIFIFAEPIYTNFIMVKNLRFAGGRHVDRMMSTLNDNAQDADTVFLHWASILAFYYYFTDHEPGYAHEYPIRVGEGTVHVIYGSEHTFNPGAYETLFQSIESVPGRLWIVFGHKWPSEEMLELERRLNQKRHLNRAWGFNGCKLLLYDALQKKM